MWWEEEEKSTRDSSLKQGKLSESESCAKMGTLPGSCALKEIELAAGLDSHLSEMGRLGLINQPR